MKKRGPKKPKPTNLPARILVAENVTIRLKQAYPQANNKTDAHKKLARACGHSASTVQRLVDPENYAQGVSVDVIANIAAALHCHPYELFLPPPRPGLKRPSPTLEDLQADPLHTTLI